MIVTDLKGLLDFAKKLGKKITELSAHERGCYVSMRSDKHYPGDLLLRAITVDLMKYLVEHYSLTPEEAIEKLKNTELFKLLLDTETGLYEEKMGSFAE